jgi:hypothetical protein
MYRSTKLDHGVNWVLPQSEDTAETSRDIRILLDLHGCEAVFAH